MGESLKPPVRILLVDHADFLGGAERSLIDLVRSMNRTLFEPIVACPPGVLLEEVQRVPVPTVPLALPQVRHQRNPIAILSRLAAGTTRLRSTIRRERIAILHSNTMRSSVFCAPAVLGTGAAFVWHVRDLHRERAYVWIMSRLADAIIANSKAVQRTIPASAQSKVTVVHNGVPLEDFDPSNFSGDRFRAAIGVPCGIPLIGNVAWIAPWKGTHQFVEAAALIAADFPEARFVIIGSVTDTRYRDYERAVKSRAIDLLGDRVVWAGARAPIQQALAGLDLLLHCADEEPFGRVLIEAMAMRIPVISFQGGGPDEIVASGESGVLVAPRDVPAMARAAVEMLRDAPRRSAMADAARRRVAQLFDSTQTARKVEAIYRALLAHR